MKAMCEDEIIPSDYPPYGYNCHGGYEFSNGTGTILNKLLLVKDRAVSRTVLDGPFRTSIPEPKSRIS